jgi:preprotein translocase subunit SecG
MNSFFLGFMAFLLIVTSCFMILLILVQRGRGGGITGALGGAGGQSAFGSKAGDVFTRITIGTAVVWITLAMMTISIFNRPEAAVLDLPSSGMRGTAEQTQPADPNAAQPGVSDTEGGQLPGETPASDAAQPSTPGQPSDPGLNPPAAAPANPPAATEGGQPAAPAEGAEKKDAGGSGG